ncbi:MAG: Bax inhibitor-1/YccA family protein [Bdellovibrionaceae bacterium]|nr:Bax inhibitor-1/YccA family protein [Pseudobdellovibrionaceae bacterium]
MARTSSNPAFNEKAIQAMSQMHTSSTEAPATIQGAVNKTMFLLLLVVAVSAISWVYAVQLLESGLLIPVVIGSAVIQIVMTFMIVKNPLRAKSFSIAYALIEGVTLGAISYLFERLYPNIVFQAILGTSGVILGMLLIYKLRIIRVTENFKIMVTAATAGICFIYIINLIMRMFGTSMPFIHEGGTWGIVFSLFVIGVAAFNLAIDFDFIEKCEEQKAPSHMEWYGAFGLMLTIIWLYVEMLRLLAKSRD